MEKKYVVPLKDAVTGVLHGNAGTYRVLIDEEASGAKQFSLLINTMNAGVKGGEVVDQITGAVGKTQLVDLINKAL